MHTLRMEYLTVNGLTDDRVKINTSTSGEGQHELNTTDV